MSWLFSQALVAASSAATCSDGAPSAPLNVTPTPLRSWLKGKTTAPFTLSLSGTTFAPLTADHGEAVLTSYLEAFPVRTSALPEAAPGYPASGRDFGANSPASFARWDRATSSWRTPQPSLFADLTSSSVTWPRWGTMRSGVCSERTTWAPRISASGCGSSVSYPTPCTIDSGSRFNTSLHEGAQPRPTLGAMARHNMWPTPTVCGNNNRNGASPTSGDGLATVVKNRLWPTPDTCAGGTGPSQINRNGPRLQDVVKWPTPNARDWKDTSITGSLNALQTENGQANLPRIVHARLLPTPKAGDGKRTDSPSERAHKSPGLSSMAAILGEQETLQTSTGALNPSWVEWLMGWPIGWTDCAPLETDRFRLWQRSHGLNFIGD
jgi:hypothetical protein